MKTQNLYLFRVANGKTWYNSILRRDCMEKYLKNGRIGFVVLNSGYLSLN